jgi:2-dehydro-3-deoxyphosphogluconate aldolase/(4S)-4-hydroxy-2-oxoglutarate aldolase
MNTEGAEQMIANAIKHYGNRLNVGAGTVCSVEDLEKAVNAGATFIVTPVMVRAVISKCVEMNIPVFPGAYTPTEIFEAWCMGASLVKVFPASTLGPDFIKSVKAPFPQIKLMPTGGINLNDISGYKKNGADAFGIGSPLFPCDLIEGNRWEQLSDHLKKFKRGWESC